jgi:hypothetical protein
MTNKGGGTQVPFGNDKQRLGETQISCGNDKEAALYHGDMPQRHFKKPGWTTIVLRGLAEIAFIIFLFYSNLLMGEFTRDSGRTKTLAAAVHDLWTMRTFAIGFVSACLGFGAIEFLRHRLLGQPDVVLDTDILRD